MSYENFNENVISYESDLIEQIEQSKLLIVVPRENNENQNNLNEYIDNIVTSADTVTNKNTVIGDNTTTGDNKDKLKEILVSWNLLHLYDRFVGKYLSVSKQI